MNKKQSIANTLDFQEFTKRAQQEQQNLGIAEGNENNDFKHKLPQCESPIEEIMLVCLQYGLHSKLIIPQYNIKQYSKHLKRVDFLVKPSIPFQYIDLNFPIAIECDSKQFHDFKKDFKISREIVSCNFMLFRFNGSEIYTHYQKILKAKTEEGVLFYNNDIMLVQELVENIQNYINTCILKSLNNKNE